MVESSVREGAWRNNGRTLELLALLLSAVVTACGALAAAWWYAISWLDITSAGLAGLLFHVFMIAGLPGVPAYCVVLILRARGRVQSPK